MSELNADYESSYLSNLLRDLSIELGSEDLEEMRSKLLAFERVNEVLSNLKVEEDIQVYQGTDVVEEYKKSIAGDDEPYRHHGLDYIVRKGNVELQLEIRIISEDGYILDDKSVDKYHSILASNTKTEEIIVVWSTNDLNSVSLTLEELQRYISKLSSETKQITVEKNKLKPLRSTIISAIQRHRHILRKLEEFQEVKGVEFDVAAKFSNILKAEISDLKSSVDRRRIPEKIQAINSISETDVSLLRDIFDKSRITDIEIDELRTLLSEIYDNLD